QRGEVRTEFVLLPRRALRHGGIARQDRAIGAEDSDGASGVPDDLAEEFLEVSGRQPDRDDTVEAAVGRRATARYPKRQAAAPATRLQPADDDRVRRAVP